MLLPQAMLRNQFEEKRAERVQKYQGMNLYIKNLHDDVTDDMLREEFAPFGSITSAKVCQQTGILLLQAAEVLSAGDCQRFQ